MSESLLVIKTVPNPELAVIRVEVEMQGGAVLRPRYRVNLFNERGGIVDMFNHTITDREWGGWGLSVYDKPYLKQIILKRYEQASGIYLELDETDELFSLSDDSEDPPVLYSDAFNEYAPVIDGYIAEEIAEAVESQPATP